MEMEWNDREQESQEWNASVSEHRHSPGLTLQGVRLSSFQRHMITGSHCEAFLEMTCVFDGDRTDIFYNTDQYVRVDEVLKDEKTGVEDVMTVCSGLLEAIRICSEYLLSAKDLSLQNEQIYCTGDLSAVKLMYVPGYQNELNIRDKLADLIDTAIEYSDSEADILCFSDYKRRLYIEGKDLRSLEMITEEITRKSRQEKNPPEPAVREEMPEKRKRAKGVSVKRGGPYSGSEGTGSGEASVLLREESIHYQKKKQKKGSGGGTSGFGTKLKSLFYTH